jgi:tocopherol O-methyltransferase
MLCAPAMKSFQMNQCLQELVVAPASAASAAERARKHYDRLALLYRLFWGDHLHHGLFRFGAEHPRAAQLELVRYCASLAQVRPNWLVLDVGCGYGATAIYLAEHHRSRCTGLTVSAIQAARAQQLSLRAGVDRFVEFMVCNAETQPLGSNIYDLVWIVESSEHFSDRAYFLKRAARALRQDGTLLLTCGAARAQTSRLRRLAEVCACQEFQTTDTYVSQISGAGLHIGYYEELTADVASTWDVVHRRILPLMPMLRFWPRPVREFARAIGAIRAAFHARDLQYWVVVARKSE